MTLKLTLICVTILGCPRHYGPGPSEDIPGEVTGLTVTFEQGTKEDRQGWVAKFSWTAPKRKKQK